MCVFPRKQRATWRVAPWTRPAERDLKPFPASHRRLQNTDCVCRSPPDEALDRVAGLQRRSAAGEDMYQ
eukprot:15475791-Alexandrium_andersonii.AAC.1